MKSEPTQNLTNLNLGTFEWNQIELGTEIILLSGQHVLAADYNSVGNGIPYVTGPTDFDGHSVRCTKWTTNPQTVCEAGDILVTVKGSGAGTLAIADKAYCISRQLMAVRPIRLESRFVFYCLLADRAELEDSATGLIPGISRKDLLEKVILLPPLPEQRAIAEVLSDVDALIEQLDALIAKKRAVKTATMQRLLTGKQRLPGFSEPWETRRLGEVAELHRQLLNPKRHADKKFSLYSIPAFDENQEPESVYGRDIGSSKFTVPESAVMVSKLNPRFPRVWGPQSVDDSSIASTEFLIFMPSSQIERDFLVYLCRSGSFNDQVLQLTTGTTGSHQRIRPGEAKEIKFELPADPNEQRAIAEILSDMDAEIEALEARRGKTQRLKQGMMQELLTGRTRLV